MDIDCGVAWGLRQREARALQGVQQWMNNAAELKQKAADLQDKLAITNCKLAGTLAIIGGFKQVHPNSPLLQPTGRVYTCGGSAGKPKTQANVLWERAYDAAGKRLGIANPSARRDD